MFHSPLFLFLLFEAELLTRGFPGGVFSPSIVPHVAYFPTHYHYDLRPTPKALVQSWQGRESFECSRAMWTMSQWLSGQSKMTWFFNPHLPWVNSLPHLALNEKAEMDSRENGCNVSSLEFCFRPLCLLLREPSLDLALVELIFFSVSVYVNSLGRFLVQM